MLDFKKVPVEGAATALGVPAVVLALLAVVMGFLATKGTYGLIALGVYFGILLIMVIFSLVKFKSFIGKSDELDDRDEPEIFSIVESVCEYFNIDRPDIRTFNSEYEEVFAVGSQKEAYLLISDVALEKLERDELEFLIIQEMVNIARGRMLALTIFAADGKTSGVGHFFAKWITAVEKSNDKILLAVTKNLEQSIRTIIKVNDFDDECEMSIDDMVRIFMNTRKSQLKNITDAIDLDPYIVDRVVELLRFSRSRDYKKLSDSVPLLNIDYGMTPDMAKSRRKASPNKKAMDVQEDVSNFEVTREEREELYSENIQGKKNDDDNVTPIGKDIYYEDVMHQKSYVNSEIELDPEEEAEKEFEMVSKKFGRSSALREVAATRDNDEDDLRKQKTTVMRDKYNIQRNIEDEEDDDYGYDDYDSTEGTKKKIILIIVGLIVIAGLAFGVKTLLIDKKDTPGKPGEVQQPDDSNMTKEEIFKGVIESFEKAFVKFNKAGDVSYEKFIVPEGSLSEKLKELEPDKEELSVKDVKVLEYSLKADDKVEVNASITLGEEDEEAADSKEIEKTYTLAKTEDGWKIESINESKDEGDSEEEPVAPENRYSESTFSPSYSYQYSAVPSSERLQGAEADEVEEFITRFNNSWVDYVNTGNKDVFNYYLKDAKAYNIAVKFANNNSGSGMTQEFEVMDIKDARKTQSAYYVWVHEKIKENVNGNVKVREYHWIYMLRKYDGVYQLQEYFSDPAYK